MQIKLTEEGPPMWFLGKPREIKISLTFAEPGPVDVDFEKLETEEQKQILVGLRDRKLEASESFQDLYSVYSKGVVKATPSKEVKEYLHQAKMEKEKDRKFKFEAEREKKEEIFNERVEFLASKSVKAIKAALDKETDLRLLRKLRDVELSKKKPRVSVKEYLQDKIKVLQAKVAQGIGGTPEKPGLFNPGKKETMNYDVVESEQEVIHFSPENLINTQEE